MPTSLLQPNESQFRTPGMAEAALRSEGEKRALYLSEMDKYYAGLEQRQKEMDQQHDQFLMGLEETKADREQRYTMFGEQLEWDRDKF